VRFLTLKRAAVVAGIVAVALLGAQIAIAITSPSTVSGRGVMQTKVVRSDTALDDTSGDGTWHTVPGMKTKVRVPSGHALILARFNAETFCNSASWCSIRMVVGKKKMQPYEGTSNAFTALNNYVSASADRSLGPVGSGTYTVKVQYNDNGSTEYWLDDMSFTVQTVKA
jgi:hypothetical protein